MARLFLFKFETTVKWSVRIMGVTNSGRSHLDDCPFSARFFILSLLLVSTNEIFAETKKEIEQTSDIAVAKIELIT